MTLLSDQHAGLTPDASRGSPVIRWSLFLALGGFLGLLVPHLSATARACSCSIFVPESRGYTVTSVTQLEGSGDHEDSELERWTGELTLSAGRETARTLDGAWSTEAVELYLNQKVSDQYSRHVRIVADSPTSDTGTWDTGTWDTGTGDAQ